MAWGGNERVLSRTRWTRPEVCPGYPKVTRRMPQERGAAFVAPWPTNPGQAVQGPGVLGLGSKAKHGGRSSVSGSKLIPPQPGKGTQSAVPPRSAPVGHPQGGVRPFSCDLAGSGPQGACWGRLPHEGPGGQGSRPGWGLDRGPRGAQPPTVGGRPRKIQIPRRSLVPVSGGTIPGFFGLFSSRPSPATAGAPAVQTAAVKARIGPWMPG